MSLEQLAGERGARVLRARFVHRRTFAAIGREEGVSGERARQLVHEAMARVVRALAKDGASFVVSWAVPAAAHMTDAAGWVDVGI